MVILKEPITNEIEINKSIFRCYLSYVSNQEEVKSFIQSIKKLNYDATHNCSAYVLGDAGEYGGSSDDGEPSKTAGVPMLEVLRKNHVTNIVAVVTRYYGGIKLGAGGLVRAYTKSVSETLKLSNLIPLKKYTRIQVVIPYPLLHETETALQNATILQRVFDASITITVELEQDLLDSIISDINNRSKGAAIIKK